MATTALGDVWAAREVVLTFAEAALRDCGVSGVERTAARLRRAARALRTAGGNALAEAWHCLGVLRSALHDAVCSRPAFSR